MQGPFAEIPKSDERTQRICPKCNSLATGEAKFCALDGTELKLGANPSTIEELARCPACSRSFPPRALFCASDGTTLARGLEPASKSEPLEASSPRQAVKESEQRSHQRTEVEQFTGFSQPKAALRSEASGNTELIGTILDDRYRIEAMIAEGGMAVLYRAHQIGMDRTVAIKIMLPTVTPNSQAAERFAQECKLAARLSHPNIVSVYDVGMIGPRQAYLVMEYIDGISLSNELSQNGPPSPATAITIISQVLKGLEEAHSAGIIHRDLKPDNILLQKKSHRSDWVKIVDFGIANLADRSKRLTKTGSFIGTPAYMSPEQFRGKALDTRVDLYSIGLVLYEILTGEVPFEGETPDVVMMKHLIDEPLPVTQLRPHLPACLDPIIIKALAKDPAHRFQTAAEFREALASCQIT
jgi:hypothetical protein